MSVTNLRSVGDCCYAREHFVLKKNCLARRNFPRKIGNVKIRWTDCHCYATFAPRNFLLMNVHWSGCLHRGTYFRRDCHHRGFLHPDHLAGRSCRAR
jgi:hypothetical protein